MLKKRIIILILITVFILLIPFVAMQFTNEVNWTLFDFVIAFVLILSAGITCDIVLKRIKNSRFRIALCFGLILVFLLIWVELAVGIFN